MLPLTLGERHQLSGIDGCSLGAYVVSLMSLAAYHLVLQTQNSAALPVYVMRCHK